MKKILTFAFAFAMIIPCMFIATGCGSFAENTFYKFSNIEVKYENNDAKTAFEEMIGMTTQEYIDFQKEEMNNAFYKFVPGEGQENEGIMEMWMEIEGEKQKYESQYQPIQYYTVDGNEIKVWMGDETKEGDPHAIIKIEGNNLVFEDTQEGVTIKQTMTKA